MRRPDLPRLKAASVNTDYAGNATLSAQYNTRGNVAAALIYITPPIPLCKDFHESYQKLRSFQTRTQNVA